MKLLVSAVAASVLLSGAAFAADPYPILANMSGIIDLKKATLAETILGDYYTSGRAVGRVPPTPDAVSVIQFSNGMSATSQTYLKK